MSLGQGQVPRMGLWERVGGGAQFAAQSLLVPKGSFDPQPTL